MEYLLPHFLLARTADIICTMHCTIVGSAQSFAMIYVSFIEAISHLETTFLMRPIFVSSCVLNWLWQSSLTDLTLWCHHHPPNRNSSWPSIHCPFHQESKTSESQSSKLFYTSYKNIKIIILKIDQEQNS